MGHSTQFEEDAVRLPEGIKRIGYDADTECYTFQDRYTGTMYRSEPGNAYGSLTPMNSPENNLQRIRPNAFAPTDPTKQRTETSANTSINSFNDFLPPTAITSSPPKLSSFSSTSDSSSGSRLAGAFRKVKAMSSVALQMQVNVNNNSTNHAKPSLSVSATSEYSGRGSPPPKWRIRGYSKLLDPRPEEDKKGLLRSKTMASVSSSRSSHNSHNAHTRSSSRSSRTSAISTTSTVTPMRTR